MNGSLMEMMAVGAATLAREGFAYSKRYKDIGFSEAEWKLLTQETPWTRAERVRVKSLLMEAVNASLTLAGIPAGPLPAEYVAAIIAKVVHPSNRLAAANRAPEAYEASRASGLKEPVKIEMVPRETMVSLVTLYTGNRIDGADVGSIHGGRADDDEVMVRTQTEDE